MRRSIARRVVELLQALGGPDRFEICRLLARGPATVSEIAEQLALAQPLVSHHVRRLRDRS